jgi:hypothetical protein
VNNRPRGCYTITSGHESAADYHRIEEQLKALAEMSNENQKAGLYDTETDLNISLNSTETKKFIEELQNPSTPNTNLKTLMTDTTNPKDMVGSKKVNLSLVPPVANIYEAKVMELGAAKYGPWNWRDTPVRLSVYLSASLRHLAAITDGQDIDPESGMSHIAHVRANTGILLDALEQGTLIDDRKTSGKAAEVLMKVEKK